MHDIRSPSHVTGDRCLSSLYLLTTPSVSLTSPIAAFPDHFPDHSTLPRALPPSFHPLPSLGAFFPFLSVPPSRLHPPPEGQTRSCVFFLPDLLTSPPFAELCRPSFHPLVSSPTIAAVSSLHSSHSYSSSPDLTLYVPWPSFSLLWYRLPVLPTCCMRCPSSPYRRCHLHSRPNFFLFLQLASDGSKGFNSVVVVSGSSNFCPSSWCIVSHTQLTSRSPVTRSYRAADPRGGIKVQRLVLSKSRSFIELCSMDARPS
jgi:hypothetical protein